MVGTRVEEPPVGLAATVRHIAVIGVAGLVTGVLVGGVGSRIFMRIAGATGRDLAQGLRTEAGFRVGEITLGGTLALIVFVGIFSGILGAALYAVFRPWLAWAGAGRGIVFGVVLFAIGSASSDVMNPDNRDFFLLDNRLIDVVAIAALFIAFGAVMEAVHRRIERRVGHDASWTAPFAAVTALGAVTAIPLLISSMFTEGGCDCGPSPLIGWSVVVTAVGTGLWWSGSRWPGTRLPGRISGYVGLIGATGFGLVRVISDAIEIIT